MSSTVRVGIIGTRWGLMHVGGFRAAGAQVVALCGRDADHTRRVAAREGIEIATSDVPALCREVDLVVVASPDAVHAEHATAALDAGRAVLSRSRWRSPRARPRRWRRGRVPRVARRS